MNQDLGLYVLGEIMSWTDDRAHEEFAWLKLMARLKYDSYRDFQAGMRFIESLATWLQQFQPGQERNAAYNFVRHALIYIGPSEVQQLAEQFYPRFVRNHLVNVVAAERGIPPYRVLADASAEEERLRRSALFMGLSDGAHIDTIRHANTGLLSNEQFVQVTQVDTEKWRDLLRKLREDLEDDTARFRVVYLIDDFTATGTSFLRFDEETRAWRGKLMRFKDSVENASESLGCKVFEEKWDLCVHHYVASQAARRTIGERLNGAYRTFSDDWCRPTCTYGMVLPSDLPINRAQGHDDFIQLTETYYDSILETKHTTIGGVTHLGLGFGRCALPLVFEHNTPNNSVALLWAETQGGNRDGTVVPAMRPLFRRRQRHL